MDISTLIASVKNLPPSPQILPRLQKLVKDPNSSMDEIIELIKRDASLTAQVLRISNSAFYGGSTQVNNLEAAINRIGLYEVYKLVSFIVSSQLFANNLSIYKLNAKSMWQNSVISGSICKHLSTYFDLDAESAYLVGLLQNIGKIVINEYYLNQGIEIYNDQQESVTPEQEVALFGFSHAAVGAELLRNWKFDEHIVQIIKNQHASTDKAGQVLVAAQEALPLFEKESTLDKTEITCLAETLKEKYAINDDAFEKFMSRTDKDVAALQAILSSI